MQRIAQSRPMPDGSHGSVRRKRRLRSASSDRPTHSSGLATLAPAFTQALPNLAGIPNSYSHEFHAELLYDLCAALVREGIGEPETWAESEGSAVLFVQSSILNGIGAERRKLLERNVEFHLNVSDLEGRDCEEVPLGNGRLAVTVECGGSGFLKVGPAIAALEEEAQGLGAAFYWTLTYAIYRVMRIYNHDDALEYEERMKEYAEEEDHPGQYEFPEVEKALPECIRNTLTGNHDVRTFRARQMLSHHRNGEYRSWIERLRTIERLSRVRLPSDSNFREDGGYDTIPLPSLLVAFKEHDAIVACFDEESQYMLEGSAEPALGVVFNPREPEEVRRALRAASRFVAFNCELFQLVEELADWETCHAGAHLDRGESSLRAA
jgi:hypothetical protein